MKGCPAFRGLLPATALLPLSPSPWWRSGGGDLGFQLRAAHSHALPDPTLRRVAEARVAPNKRATRLRQPGCVGTNPPSPCLGCQENRVCNHAVWKETKTPPLPRQEPTGESTKPAYSRLRGVGQMAIPICALQVPPGGSLGKVFEEAAERWPCLPRPSLERHPQLFFFL
jgi:hypothetical protein